MEQEEAGEARQAMSLHLATGMGLSQAMAFRREMEPELCRRIVEARRRSRARKEREFAFLEDPIGEEEEFRERVAEAKAEALAESEQWAAEREAERIESGSSGMPVTRGLCHLMWRLTKEKLAAQGIVWYSPAELNPCCVFD